MNEDLIHEFLTLNKTEALQKKDHKFIPDYDQKSIVKNSDNKDRITIFTPNFLEINYCLRGTAHEIVGSHPVTLSQGDILVIDVGTPHSIKALADNDILINILLRNKIDSSLGKIINSSKNANIHSKFLLSNDQFNKYLIYHSTQTESQLQNLADLIIEEYFQLGEFSDDLQTI